MFREEAQAMTAAGHNPHLIDTEALTAGAARIRPPLEPGACVVYRGWMLTYGEYVNLAASVEKAGGYCFTSPEQYLATHHLPNWYAVSEMEKYRGFILVITHIFALNGYSHSQPAEQAAE